MTRPDDSPAEKPDADLRGIQLHARLILREPAAIEQFWTDYYERLVRVAMEQLHAGPDREDRAYSMALAVIDKTITRPERFDPDRGKSLWGYLRMDLQGDLRNYFDWAKRNPRPISLEPADDDDDDAVGNGTGAGNLVSNDPRPDDVFESGESLERVWQIGEQVGLTNEEQTVFELQYIQGEKATSAFADRLGIAHLSDREQRDIVQKIKDRLAKRLRRQVRETPQ